MERAEVVLSSDGSFPPEDHQAEQSGLSGGEAEGEKETYTDRGPIQSH